MAEIRFFVAGIPKPGGSKRAFYIPKAKRTVITEDCKASKDWRASVAHEANLAVQEPIAGPVFLLIEFLFPRPKGHFNSKNLLLPAAPQHHLTTPDCSKLTRSTEDSMKGIAWLDDKQVIWQDVRKRYMKPGEKPGAWITIEAL